MKKILEGKHPVKIWTKDVEPEAEKQLRNVASLPFIHKHVAAMPDVHFGLGATVGSVIATKGAIIPAAVGVDIGCGMRALKLPVKIDAFERVAELRHSIERAIPVGFNQNKEVSETADLFFKEHGFTLDEGKAMAKARHQLGSLGGGNHFIELCQDEDKDAWVVLHSGSRGIGNLLARRHIERAKGIMKDYFISVPDPDLAYFAQNTVEFDNYIEDLLWAQSYAKANREEMMKRIKRQISFHLYNEERSLLCLEEYDCHHNYTQVENHFGKNVWLTRKGAVSARAGEVGIIPGSMGTKSYIVLGLGNPESFHSCSHGAGRCMSRTQARKQFSEKDLIEQTMGVECKKDASVVDEIPGAYKDIDTVMENQKDLVRIVHTLKQVLCIKG